MFGQEHVDRYRETDGEEGHDWQDTRVLLLTTTGRNRRHRGRRRR
ncbi:MAG TPA: nitroreductase/quinone reductase family protein [Solirubrobacteraceae bacterium]